LSVKSEAARLQKLLEVRSNQIQTTLKAVEKALEEENIKLNLVRNEGDLRENEDFTITSQRVGMLESQRRQVMRAMQTFKEFNLNNYVSDGTFVVLGTTIVFENQNTLDQYTMMLVPPDLADAEAGFMATNCPVGEKVLNKRVGDIIGVRASRGEQTYLIKEVY
jgi:transcription elongation GreA/GreB family factor